MTNPRKVDRFMQQMAHWVIVLTLLVNDVKAYSLSGFSDYYLGSIVRIDFKYDSNQAGLNFTFELLEKNTSLLTCYIDGDRGQPGPDGSLVQTVLISSYNYVCYKTLTATVGDDTSRRNATLEFKLLPHIGVREIGNFLEIHIYGNGLFLGTAKHTMNDSNLPWVSRTSQIEIKLSKVDMGTTYKMELHRIDDYAKELCPTSTLGGKIDLQKFMALRSFMNCELDMDTPSLEIQEHVMPFGYIQVTVRISHRGHQGFAIQEDVSIQVCVSYLK
ncbi:hypothetical protein EGW08_004633 [Elysia chlorotica]|uniref:Uncharacterized protein n=1 Tax=Elysia chlorotica TaxID=188477 RepID=A0A433U1H1_ELYCH|nr:hypothetical protein EGW08_004633 [Elysia chlorotica]